MLGYLYMEELTKKRLTSRVVLAILATGIFAFLGILDSTATTVTFPILMREFNVSTDIIQWFTLAGTLAFSIVGFTNLAVYRVTSFWVSGCIALGVVSFIA